MTARDLVLVGSYDYRLIAVSIVIAITASYTALDLAGRVTSARARGRLVWLICGTTVMGIGIWSMHNTAMLSFRLAGGTYVSPALAERLAIDLHDDAVRPVHETLSDREFEVLRMIASGKTVSQIAEKLHLSVATVSTYRARILEKMNMTTTAELMHYALSNHLVD